MSYFKDEAKGNARNKRDNNRLSILSDTSGRDAGSPFIKFYELEPAQVIKVIMDEDDPDFENYSDIGRVKFRFMYSDAKRVEEDLPLAYPMHSNVVEYPVANEVVIIAEYLGDYYYTRRLNLFNFVNNNIFQGFTDISQKPTSQKDSLNTYQKSEQGFAKNEKQANPYTKFIPNNSQIHPVKLDEGDTVLYGRFGNFIKYDSNEDNEPNIKIVGGQSLEKQENSDDLREPLEEDINTDRSSIWLTSNLDVPFEPSTVDQDEHLRSYVGKKPDEYGGEQIIVTSDRLVFNSKNRDILLFGGNGIAFTSGDKLSIDAVNDLNVATSEDHNLTVTGSYDVNVNEDSTHVYNNTLDIEIGDEWNAAVGTSVSVDSPEIELGSPDDTQRMVLGEDLNEALLDLITALLENQATFVSTATGPGALTPGIVQALTKIRTTLQTQDLLSQKNRSQ